MRIWSLHPAHLDAKGLVALWRETLLAKHVLEGKTKGYNHHPQLNRFKAAPRPLHAINQYLSEVWSAASQKGYNFDRNKIDWSFEPLQLMVTSGQVQYETSHLLKKLEQRDPAKLAELLKLQSLSIHPMFYVEEGEIEDWERP